MTSSFFPRRRGNQLTERETQLARRLEAYFRLISILFSSRASFNNACRPRSAALFIVTASPVKLCIVFPCRRAPGVIYDDVDSLIKR